MQFLGEKHGKNGRDSHFGVLSRTWEQASRKRDITTIEEVAVITNRLHDTYAIVLADTFDLYGTKVVEFPSFTGAYGFRSHTSSGSLEIMARTSANDPWRILVHSLKPVFKKRKEKLPPQQDPDDSDDHTLTGLHKKKGLIAAVEKRLDERPRRGRKRAHSTDSESSCRSTGETESVNPPPKPSPKGRKPKGKGRGRPST
eukprot:TRINITY_DN22046_c0_g2_i1.p1 TRINITY_DN22046_c0_g2~~TRINITY_DN22046_c0_g2_i1.p1  ORF type:complete len:200 (+),score=3.07 TRINITY_DN22046_c0_g2_i1:643-1242(+)